jgi:hypothetical protein
MRTETTTRTLYQFDELSDEAKETAREWWRSSLCDDFELESTLDAIAEAGNLLGIDFARKHGKRAIWFSGFWSQGDGASYDGTWRAADCNARRVLFNYTGDSKSNVELRRIAAGLLYIAAAYPDSRASVSSSHRGHFLTMDCEPGDDAPDNFGLNYESDEYDAAMQEWSDAFPADELEQLLRDFASWAYRLLESEYEYQNSDEQVDESLRAGEYEFTEEGERV